MPKITLKSNQDHLWLKQGWYKDTMACLNHLGISENATLQNINNIKNSITSKFIEKMLGEKDLEVKRKLRYYKEVINPTVRRSKVSLCFNRFKEKKLI